MVRWREKQVREVHTRMRKVVSHLVRDTKIKLNVMKRSIGPRGGIVYRPSLPGQYPHKRTGGLQRSTQGRVLRRGDKEVDGYIFSTIEYAKYLEGGLRPFLQKNIRENLSKIRGFLFKKM